MLPARRSAALVVAAARCRFARSVCSTTKSSPGWAGRLRWTVRASHSSREYCSWEKSTPAPTPTGASAPSWSVNSLTTLSSGTPTSWAMMPMSWSRSGWLGFAKSDWKSGWTVIAALSLSESESESGGMSIAEAIAGKCTLDAPRWTITGSSSHCCSLPRGNHGW